jgi:excinuclease ABC subunit C
VDSIGEQSAEKLLKHFKSVKKIKEADFDELEKVIGKAKAEKLTNWLKIKKAGE